MLGSLAESVAPASKPRVPTIMQSGLCLLCHRPLSRHQEGNLSERRHSQLVESGRATPCGESGTEMTERERAGHCLRDCFSIALRWLGDRRQREELCSPLGPSNL